MQSGRAPKVQSDSNHTQSYAIRRNQTQSDALSMPGALHCVFPVFSCFGRPRKGMCFVFLCFGPAQRACVLCFRVRVLADPPQMSKHSKRRKRVHRAGAVGKVRGKVKVGIISGYIVSIGVQQTPRIMPAVQSSLCMALVSKWLRPKRDLKGRSSRRWGHNVATTRAARDFKRRTNTVPRTGAIDPSQRVASSV